MSERYITRRRFLAASAATGLALGLATSTGAQETTPSPEDIETTFVLGGQIPGWVGQAPESIADLTNPALEVLVGRTYQVFWDHIDTAPHNFAIRDADGNNLQVIRPLEEPIQTEELGALNETTPTGTEATTEMATGTPTETPTEEAATEEGTTQPETTEGTPTEGELVDETEVISEGSQAFLFTATEEMDQYYCTIHPDSMVGDIAVASQSMTNGETTTEE